ncbi:alpha-amylase family protein [Parafrankia elaeagni]|uniref:alpha-amylase family protein n=1 Tax=Parafrankia elaeagni TaxID=222534 RepID=UPI000366C75E|nr:alpha-amylase family protein [Parafrankia elaeagni]
MRLTRTGDLWWKTAVVYCLDVETFSDSDGDGCGDFRGLSQRLDHLHELGVTCLWLMPFYPSPDRDDGYDITDFYGVDPRLGTHGDLVEFLRLARDRGIRVIIDLVVNHTSDQHPWFRSARSSRDSPYRDFYVWRDEPPEDGPSDVVFPDKEDSVWQYDEEAGQYYLHRFYKHQPDLDVTSPDVRDEIARVLGFWLELGVSGFRVDAVPFLLETAGALDAEDLPNPHDFLRDLRAFLSRRSGEAILLGEVNLPYPELRTFFGDEDGDELTMCFDFPGMQQLYLAMAREDASVLATTLRERPAAPKDGHWATFVRNHDELTLDKLSDDERGEVFAAFGPDPSMQLYDRGLRRRLPPMLDGDPARLRLVYSLLFALPGTPTLFYGEEIGMGENLAAEGRLAVRTPMQWTDGPNGGFSAVEPDHLVGPVVEGDFAPAKVNVAAQQDDPDSLLSWFTAMIRVYRRCPELAWGDGAVLDCPGAPALFVHRSDLDGQTVVTVHNLGREPVATRLALAGVESGDRLTQLAGSGGFRGSHGSGGSGGDLTAGDGGAVDLDLAGYGYCWLRIRRRGTTGTG